ncbi:MAG: hypothetical protein RLZZ611_2228 [Cyanobacteriota bacterium]|jgi:predicted Zn-dependent protease
MKASTIAVSAAVTAICAGILVALTDLEVSMSRWWNCGPFATALEQQSRICSRQR